MSKTDKDRPLWVRANDTSLKRVPYHDHLDRWGNVVDCDIEMPTVYNDAYRGLRQCGYDIYQDSWLDTPSRKVRHYEWFGPVRAKMRDSLRAQVREYNTYGEVDDAIFIGDHRNTPLNGYWN